MARGSSGVWWVIGGAAVLLLAGLAGRQAVVARRRRMQTQLPGGRLALPGEPKRRTPFERATQPIQRAAEFIEERVVEPVREAVETVAEYDISRVLSRVLSHESGGRYDAINPNTDGAGLSYGLIQWSQSSGNLGVLLQGMRDADPAMFATVFGPSWAPLLSVTKAGKLDAVDGTVLWKEPWISRFRTAAQHGPFRMVQDRIAQTGKHWQAAERIARTLGVKSERAMAMFFDRSVQQGENGAPSIAEKLVQQYAVSGWPPEQQRIQDFGRACYEKFRSSTSRGDRWRQVGGEWHMMSKDGNIDLYEDVKKRVNKVLADASLSDDLVDG